MIETDRTWRGNQREGLTARTKVCRLLTTVALHLLQLWARSLACPLRSELHVRRGRFVWLAAMHARGANNMNWRADAVVEQLGGGQ